uniref:RGS domain-containing protein n=1 Tax=Mola mola TaxID=94237 RepID=A0A3Q4BZ23_MOLML
MNRDDCVVSGLRRSLSEGSLLQEPRSPRFLSDSTIHRLTRPPNWDLNPAPCPPSIHTLKKQLTREGGSLHHMLLFLNGTKVEPGPAQIRPAQDGPELRRSDQKCDYWGNVMNLVLSEGARVHEEVCLHWLTVLFLSFYLSDGLAVFRHFLRSEFSDENLDFWLAVERFKKTRSANKMATRAAKIYDEFISTTAGRQVNVDSSVRESTYQRLRPEVNPASFQLAQDQIFSLMETDSYPRFLRSPASAPPRWLGCGPVLA